jgi:hypothetical protein
MLHWIKDINGRFQEVEVVEPVLVRQTRVRDWDEEDVPEDYPIEFDNGDCDMDWRDVVPSAEVPWLESDLDDVAQIGDPSRPYVELEF